MTGLQKHWMWFFVLFAVSLLLGGSSFLRTLALAWGNDEYTHILLILPLSIALVCLDRRVVSRADVWDFRVGPSLVLTAGALCGGAWFWSSSMTADVRFAVNVFALVLSWIGIFVLCFGLRAAQALLFPLLFLFALVPLPGNVLAYAISFLQIGSAWSTHALFAICGVPVVQQGVMLTIPNLTIQVAQECSSIRSSSMLLITTMVLAHLLLRSPWRKVLVIALAVPLSVAKNGLRIFAIAMLGTRVDPAFLTGRLHRHGGIIFFIIALLGIFALLAILQMRENLRKLSNPDRIPAGVAGD